MPDAENDRIKRRVPSVTRRISELDAKDMRVSIIGTVVDIQGSNMVMDDGSGRVNVRFESPPDAGPNQLVRVFGRVVPIGDGVEIEGEIIQDMTRLDKDLYKKINSLK